ncbi:MAG: superinfection immunity protein [Candidatus Korobacteraceae bacterium]
MTAVTDSDLVPVDTVGTNLDHRKRVFFAYSSLVTTMLRTIAISVAQAAAILLGAWLCVSLTRYVFEKDPFYTGPLLILLFYFLPIGVAALRKHNSLLSIIVTNLWLGWTVIGWIVALIWACDTNVEADYD